MCRYIYDLMTKALYLNTFHPHQFRLKKPPKKQHDVIGVTKLSRSKIPLSDLMEKKQFPKNGAMYWMEILLMEELLDDRYSFLHLHGFIHIPGCFAGFLSHQQ